MLEKARYKYFMKKGHSFCIIRLRKKVLREVEKFTSMKSKGTFAKVKGTLS